MFVWIMITLTHFLLGDAHLSLESSNIRVAVLHGAHGEISPALAVAAHAAGVSFKLFGVAALAVDIRARSSAKLYFILSLKLSEEILQLLGYCFGHLTAETLYEHVLLAF